jgi:hypothetical protein
VYIIIDVVHIAADWEKTISMKEEKTTQIKYK